MLARRDALDQVGGLDERYFLYCEETDLCLQVSRAGWEVRHTPAMTILHGVDKDESVSDSWRNRRTRGASTYSRTARALSATRSSSPHPRPPCPRRQGNTCPSSASGGARGLALRSSRFSASLRLHTRCIQRSDFGIRLVALCRRRHRGIGERRGVPRAGRSWADVAVRGSWHIAAVADSRGRPAGAPADTPGVWGRRDGACDPQLRAHIRRRRSRLCAGAALGHHRPGQVDGVLDQRCGRLVLLRHWGRPVGFPLPTSTAPRKSVSCLRLCRLSSC